LQDEEKISKKGRKKKPEDLNTVVEKASPQPLLRKDTDYWKRTKFPYPNP